METLFIGKNLLFLPEVESTNTYAMNLLRNVNTIDGTVVFTDNQTNGRGQRGALWNSEIGQNITISIILKPHFLSIEKTFYLSKIAALAIYDVLTDVLVNSQYDIKIKWPNDILVDKQKIAGILIENNIHSNSTQHCVIGIGLNVNQTEFKNLEMVATSLKKLTDIIFDRNTILNKLCIFLEKWYLKLKEQKYDIIDQIYLKNLLGINEILQFKDVNNRLFLGEILGVEQDGKLKVLLSDKSIKYFELKEIKFEY